MPRRHPGLRTVQGESESLGRQVTASTRWGTFRVGECRTMVLAKFLLACWVLHAAPAAASGCMASIEEQLLSDETFAFLGTAVGHAEPPVPQCERPHDELPLLLFAVEETDDGGQGFVEARYLGGLDALFSRPSELDLALDRSWLERSIIVAYREDDGELTFGDCARLEYTLESSWRVPHIEAALDKRWSRTSPSLEDEPLAASIEDLVRQPAVFAGRRVQTRGYVRLHWDHCCSIFATRAARRAFDRDRSVELRLFPLSTEREPLLASWDGPIASLRPFASGPAAVTATFVFSDDDLWVGALVDASLVPLKADGVEELEATFAQGMEQKLTPAKAGRPR